MEKANYQKSLVSLSNSILKHFNVTPFHETLKEADDFLNGKRKVILFLFDGMGKCIIEKHLSKDSFLRKHILTTISSTIPPTTVAATNALLSGKYPVETGWLGWSQYFKKYTQNVDVFMNWFSKTKVEVPVKDLMKKTCPYDSIATLINNANNKEIAVERFGYPVSKFSISNAFLKQFIAKSFKITKQKDEAFTYAYWPKPDHYMHRVGTNHKSIYRYVNKINKLVEKYSKKNKDVSVMVIADHGFMDVKYLDLADHPDIINTFLHPISFEGRCVNFFIKNEFEGTFAVIFKKYYGDHFTLLTKKEVLEQHIFGDAEASEIALEFIGDFVAFANDQYYLYDSSYKKKTFLPGHHAGATKDELEVSLIGIN